MTSMMVASHLTTNGTTLRRFNLFGVVSPGFAELGGRGSKAFRSTSSTSRLRKTAISSMLALKIRSGGPQVPRQRPVTDGSASDQEFADPALSSAGPSHPNTLRPP
jgi:hypothetical protein